MDALNVLEDEEKILNKLYNSTNLDLFIEVLSVYMEKHLDEEDFYPDTLESNVMNIFNQYTDKIIKNNKYEYFKKTIDNNFNDYHFARRVLKITNNIYYRNEINKALYTDELFNKIYKDEIKTKNFLFDLSYLSSMREDYEFYFPMPSIPHVLFSKNQKYLIVSIEHELVDLIDKKDVDYCIFKTYEKVLTSSSNTLEINEFLKGSFRELFLKLEMEHINENTKYVAKKKKI